ncbi:MAG: prepilin peptidase [Thermoplasmata archaeon]|nr:prepilin peptidase [Thermoplasmata archaeon]
MELFAWAGIAATLVGLSYAAWSDWKTREVSDHLWEIMAAIGAVTGFFAFGTTGPVAAVLWVVASLFVVQHLVPWDVPVERLGGWVPGVVELGFYLGTFLVLAAAFLRFGLGPEGVPVAVVAVYASVVLARVMFEVGLLYGGADAKALMVAGLLVPLDAAPLVALPTTASTVLAIYPFALTLIMNAALLSLAIPIGIALRNVRAGDFEFPRGFVGYRIPVEQLPEKFVWLRDPTFRRESEAAETSGEDRKIRERQARDLVSAGVKETWVTPQLPFVVLIAAGGLAAVLAGNLLFDLFAVL